MSLPALPGLTPALLLLAAMVGCFALFNRLRRKLRADEPCSTGKPGVLVRPGGGCSADPAWLEVTPPRSPSGASDGSASSPGSCLFPRDAATPQGPLSPATRPAGKPVGRDGAACDGAGLGEPCSSEDGCRGEGPQISFRGYLLSTDHMVMFAYVHLKPIRCVSEPGVLVPGGAAARPWRGGRGWSRGLGPTHHETPGASKRL